MEEGKVDVQIPVIIQRGYSNPYNVRAPLSSGSSKVFLYFCIPIQPHFNFMIFMANINFDL